MAVEETATTNTSAAWDVARTTFVSRESALRRFWRTIREHRTLLAGLLILAVMLFVVAAGPALTPYDPSCPVIAFSTAIPPEGAAELPSILISRAVSF